MCSRCVERKRICQVHFYLTRRDGKQEAGREKKEKNLAVAQGLELAICQNEFSSTKQQAIIEG